MANKANYKGLTLTNQEIPASIQHSLPPEVLQSILGEPLTELFLNSSKTTMTISGSLIMIEFELVDPNTGKHHYNSGGRSVKKNEKYAQSKRSPSGSVSSSKKEEKLMESLRYFFKGVNDQLIIECENPEVKRFLKEGHIEKEISSKASQEDQQISLFDVKFKPYCHCTIMSRFSHYTKRIVQCYSDDVLQPVLGTPLTQLFLHSSTITITIDNDSVENIEIEFDLISQEDMRKSSLLQIVKPYLNGWLFPCSKEEEGEKELVDYIRIFCREANAELIKKRKELNIEHFLKTHLIPR